MGYNGEALIDGNCYSAMEVGLVCVLKMVVPRGKYQFLLALTYGTQIVRSNGRVR